MWSFKGVFHCLYNTIIYIYKQLCPGWLAENQCTAMFINFQCKLYSRGRSFSHDVKNSSCSKYQRSFDPHTFYPTPYWVSVITSSLSRRFISTSLVRNLGEYAIQYLRIVEDSLWKCVERAKTSGGCSEPASLAFRRRLSLPVFVTSHSLSLSLFLVGSHIWCLLWRVLWVTRHSLIPVAVFSLAPVSADPPQEVAQMALRLGAAVPLQTMMMMPMKKKKWKKCLPPKDQEQKEGSLWSWSSGSYSSQAFFIISLCWFDVCLSLPHGVLLHWCF